MKDFSRKVVLIIIVVFAQSSLGTKADLVYSKSLGQNGYKKFEDGFLIQWGYSSSSSGNKTIYIPTSFYDANYCVNITFRTASDISSVVSAYLISQSTSSFVMKGRFIVGSNMGDSTNPFMWIAIGKWK